jgi:hypothetical protein
MHAAKSSEAMIESGAQAVLARNPSDSHRARIWIVINGDQSSL